MVQATDCNRISVDEWLQAFFMATTCDGVTFFNDKEVTIDEIKRELRFAVIREESVGTFDIKADGYPLLDNPFPLTLNKKPLRGWDEYDLIPRKTQCNEQNSIAKM